MTFTIKKAFNLKIAKTTNFTKIYGQNLGSGHTQFWSRNRIKITLLLPHKIYAR